MTVWWLQYCMIFFFCQGQKVQKERINETKRTTQRLCINKSSVYLIQKIFPIGTNTSTHWDKHTHSDKRVYSDTCSVSVHTYTTRGNQITHCTLKHTVSYKHIVPHLSVSWRLIARLGSPSVGRQNAACRTVVCREFQNKDVLDCMKSKKILWSPHCSQCQETWPIPYPEPHSRKGLIFSCPLCSLCLDWSGSSATDTPLPPLVFVLLYFFSVSLFPQSLEMCVLRSSSGAVISCWGANKHNTATCGLHMNRIRP